MRSRADVLPIVALAAVVVGVGAVSLVRAGYSPDEEYTLFAVRGIHAHGLPLLPSGLLYDRGLLYSYVSWLATTVTGYELPAFRALSVLSGVWALVVGYTLVRGIASRAAGVLAALLVASSVPFWAVATTGRFYAPFLLTCVGVLAVVAHLRSLESGGAEAGQGRRLWLLLAFIACLSRLTHELAFTLIAIPAAGTALSIAEGRRTEPRRSSPIPQYFADRHHLRHLQPPHRDWLAISLAIAAGLIAAQALLIGLHFVTPAGGGTMIERFFLWQVLNLFERPSGAPLGVVCAGVIVAWLLVPARAAFSLLVGGWAAAGVLVTALGYAAATAAGSLPPVQSVAVSSLAYPLDMFWFLAGTRPVMVWMALALLVARLCGAGGEWPAGERAAHLGWVGWVVWFGIIESGITINYVLLPTVCMLGAIGIDLVAVGQHTGAVWPGRRGQAIRAVLVGAALVVVADQWSGTGSLRDRLAAARPTIDIAGLDTIRNSLQPTDRVACSDELACLLLVGKVDVWLALDDYVRERFLVMDGANGVGVYAAAPAAFTPKDLFAPGPDGLPPARVLVVDVFKEYPVGNSRNWLPRALDADGLGVRPLLATPQARVVEVLAHRGGVGAR